MPALDAVHRGKTRKAPRVEKASVPVESPAEKRRRTNRRTGDEIVNRVLEKKFADFSEYQCNELVVPDHGTLVEYLTKWRASAPNPKKFRFSDNRIARARTMWQMPAGSNPTIAVDTSGHSQPASGCDDQPRPKFVEALKAALNPNHRNRDRTSLYALINSTEPVRSKEWHGL